MRKWNIKYSGTRNDDPDAFLMRIEEGRDLVPVSDANLLRVIPFFLQGIALSWFRGSKHLWRTFEQFARAFRVRFGDSDFQFELRQEIHLRTQGERESVSDYLTCMRAMFDKLKPRMSEAEEVSYAHRNLLPRLHLAIHRNEIEDFVHLEYLANIAQKSYRVARSYKPPPVPERSLLPDLAYRDPNYRRSEKRSSAPRERLTFLEEEAESPEFEEPVDLAYLSLEKRSNGRTDGRTKPGGSSDTRAREPKAPTPKLNNLPENPTPRVFKCWNCGEPGHGFTSCTGPRNRFCFGCGQKDVTKPECPRCSGN